MIIAHQTSLLDLSFWAPKWDIPNIIGLLVSPHASIFTNEEATSALIFLGLFVFHFLYIFLIVFHFFFVFLAPNLELD